MEKQIKPIYRLYSKPFCLILFLFSCLSFTSRLKALSRSDSDLITDTIPLTKEFNSFGFKNLFTAFSYNPSIPYKQQVNPNAELFMRDYLKAHRNDLLQLKKSGGIYFDMIDQILNQYHLPKELKYLAVIESHLKANATSWVGAAGPWQFMPETARDYGLIVNEERDDRRDFFASTHAAAKMLNDLFALYQDWLLVIAAYNGGPGRVNSAIQKSKSNDFWTLQHFLPEESRNHVKKFIATHYVMETENTIVGFQNRKDPKSGMGSIKGNVKTESIKGKYISHIIIKELKISQQMFEQLNPDFDKQMRLHNQYNLTLPEDIMLCFNESKSKIMSACVKWLIEQN
jgi:membrane-bound lytic murein transglycosylase D